MTRTYGTYDFEGAVADDIRSRGRWVLWLEPAAAIRVKRVLGRVQQGRVGAIYANHSPEVARDIEWFMERWPLVPATPAAAAMLTGAATVHRTRETAVGQILADTRPTLDIPHELGKTPRDYQVKAVELLRVRKRLLLTDEVGLGKTFTGLLNLVHADALPALVVPPTHLPRRWITELTEAFPWLTVETASKTTPPAGDQLMLPDVLIVPYSKLAGWRDHLAGRMRSVIFDEVQDLRRGTETQKGMAASHIADGAEYVLGLTATPVYNYGGEIWELLNIIAPGELGSRDEFLREWGGYTGGMSRQVSVKDPSGLGSYLRENGLMLGRTRAEVGRELPKTIKVPQFVDADPAALEKVAGDSAALARLILSNTSTTQERFRAAGDLDWKMREATGISKAPYVAEFVRLLLESENKVVLFGWHRAVYDIWNEALAEFKPAMYTGTESPTQKAAAEEAFINGDARILIMSLRSGAGVDGLQKAANVAVFGELDWSPQVHEQAIGRLRRDGMGEAPPVAYFLNSASGSDPAIMETLQVKRNQAEPLLSKDGKLFTNSVQDTSRAQLLARQVLGILGTTNQQNRSQR